MARYCLVQRRKRRVLWLDAHADFNTSDVTPSANIHGMPVACLHDHGQRELIEMVGSLFGKSTLLRMRQP